jgi:hypothetical protein
VGGPVEGGVYIVGVDTRLLELSELFQVAFAAYHGELSDCVEVDIGFSSDCARVCLLGVRSERFCCCSSLRSVPPILNIKRVSQLSDSNRTR